MGLVLSKILRCLWFFLFGWFNAVVLSVSNEKLLACLILTLLQLDNSNCVLRNAYAMSVIFKVV